jgi:hypothetical protein
MGIAPHMGFRVRTEGGEGREMDRAPGRQGRARWVAHGPIHPRPGEAMDDTTQAKNFPKASIVEEKPGLRV